MKIISSTRVERPGSKTKKMLALFYILSWKVDNLRDKTWIWALGPPLCSTTFHAVSLKNTKWAFHLSHLVVFWFGRIYPTLCSGLEGPRVTQSKNNSQGNIAPTERMVNRRRDETPSGGLLESAIPENRELKKWKFSFFHQRYTLLTSFDIFVVTYSVTNFLQKKLNFHFWFSPIFGLCPGVFMLSLRSSLFYWSMVRACFQFAMMETVISAIVDEVAWLREGKWRKTLFTLALCIGLFFLGLPCCSRVSCIAVPICVVWPYPPSTQDAWCSASRNVTSAWHNATNGNSCCQGGCLHIVQQKQCCAALCSTVQIMKKFPFFVLRCTAAHSVWTKG